MSGQQRSSDVGAGTAESVAAGCSLSERYLRPKINPRKLTTINNAINTTMDLEGLAVFTWGRGSLYVG
jgi:hypothetical protein